MGKETSRREFINFPKIQNVQELEERIRLWYEQEEETPTITGLALYLGLSDKSELYMLKKNPEYAPLIKAAALHVEHGYELGLRSNDKVGCIFGLKNFGWQDSPDTQINFGIAANGLAHQINDAQQEALQSARTQTLTLDVKSKVGQEYFE